MTKGSSEGIPLERVPTSVPGLDTVLGGGLFGGGVYILQGAPGAGKTILANQICFGQVRAQKRVVYVTLLAETHGRMLQNLASLDFFDAELLRKSVTYLSAFRALEEEGLKGLVTLLRREMRAADAALLVIDGLVTVDEVAGSEREFKKFIHELQIHSSMRGCTTLLLTSGAPQKIRPEHTMVDGIIELREGERMSHPERALAVTKFRGSGFLRGPHAFRITDRGITVYPRIESLYARPDRQDRYQAAQLSSGIPSLDAVMGGGIPSRSTTMLLGAAGLGKTTAGLHFLSECSAKEPGLFFGFYEMPDRLLAKADALGLPFRKKVEQGHVRIIWHPATDHLADALVEEMFEDIRARKVRRLFLDGLTALRDLLRADERMSPFFASFTNELRVMDVTTVFSYEAQRLVGDSTQTPLTGLSAVTENLLLMRYFEAKDRLVRLLSILKVRDSDTDPRLREFQITSRGMKILRPRASRNIK